MNRFQRSFRLLSESLAIVRADRSLLLFPVLSAVFTVLAVVLIFVPAALLAGVALSAGRPHATLALLAASALAGYAATAVATYFNVALASCAARSFHGEQTNVGEGLRAANARIGSILLWALIAALVGTIARAVEQRAGVLGNIVAGLLGAAWAVATYFVVPVLAFEQVGPADAVRRSLQTVRRSWGESLIGNVGLGIAGFVLMLPLVLLGLIGAGMVSQHPGAGVALLAVTALLFVALMVVGSAMGQVYKTAVYLYATNGEVVGYSSELLEGAFREKRSLRRRLFG
ncbi:MAG: hypothetical protein QOI17_254 [Gaiellales bacterium]|nr:hypothetical protein [Gaiellales bacterium]